MLQLQPIGAAPSRNWQLKTSLFVIQIITNSRLKKTRHWVAASIILCLHGLRQTSSSFIPELGLQLELIHDGERLCAQLNVASTVFVTVKTKSDQFDLLLSLFLGAFRQIESLLQSVSSLCLEINFAIGVSGAEGPGSSPVRVMLQNYECWSWAIGLNFFNTVQSVVEILRASERKFLGLCWIFDNSLGFHGV
jgi:hypothetical protein